MSLNNPQWQQIVACLEQKRLPQAWLFLGPLPLVLNNFAIKAISLILCKNQTTASKSIIEPCMHCSSCQMIALLEHPDVQWVKSEKAGGAIKIDQIRALQQWSYLTPNLGNHKIIVIEAAHRMNGASANALLKILEEPCLHTHFILIAQQRATILPTVLSRSQIINFPMPEDLADKNLLALGQLYAFESNQSQLMQDAEFILNDLIELLEDKKHPCALALQWQKYELETMLWFLYLVYSQLQYLFFYQTPIQGLGMKQFLQLKGLLNPLLVFKQIDKINAMIKKISLGIHANTALALEDLLFALLTD